MLLYVALYLLCCRELQPYDEPACRAATYDFSGQYLAVGGSDLRVYAPKQVRLAVVRGSVWPVPVPYKVQGSVEGR